MRIMPLLFISSALNLACVAQSAKVIFYTPSLSAKDAAMTGIVPVGNAPFPGWLYDAGERLAHFQRGRFVILNLSPGKHTFSASGSSKKPSTKTLSLDLARGEQYCVRLRAKYVNWVVLPISSYEGEIEQVPCAKAVDEAQKDKALPLERIEKVTQGMLDPTQELPSQRSLP